MHSPLEEMFGGKKKPKLLRSFPPGLGQQRKGGGDSFGLRVMEERRMEVGRRHFFAFETHFQYVKKAFNSTESELHVLLLVNIFTSNTE